MIFADTHVLAWLASGDRRLPPAAREILFSETFEVSSVTAFEYTELHQRGRLPAEVPLARVLAEFEAEVVDFPASAWFVASELPPIHYDPVDRMLVAHALTSDAALATADTKMRRYPVRLLW